MTLQVDIVSNILIHLIPFTALLLGVVLVLNVQEWQWSLAVKQGIKGVLYVKSDSWSMTRFKRVERLSWCTTVSEFRTFVYQYSNN